MSAQLSDGQYVIVSALDPTKVLEVQGGQAHDDAQVGLGEDHEETYQRWQFTKVSDEGGVFYTIGHPKRSLVMEAFGAREKSAVVMREYRDGDDHGNGQWRIQPAPGQENVYTSTR